MLDVCINNLLDRDLTEFDEIIERILNYTLEKENITDDSEVSIIYVDQDTIQDLNKNYRNIDKVTDVISFAFNDTEDEIYYDEEIDIDEPNLLGDIYICIDRALEQADEYNHSFKRELLFLTVHGFLHLLGYDHLTEQESEIMFGKQEEILNAFSITR